MKRGYCNLMSYLNAILDWGRWDAYQSNAAYTLGIARRLIGACYPNDSSRCGNYVLNTADRLGTDHSFLTQGDRYGRFTNVKHLKYRTPIVYYPSSGSPQDSTVDTRSADFNPGDWRITEASGTIRVANGSIGISMLFKTAWGLTQPFSIYLSLRRETTPDSTFKFDGEITVHGFTNLGDMSSAFVAHGQPANFRITPEEVEQEEFEITPDTVLARIDASRSWIEEENVMQDLWFDILSQLYSGANNIANIYSLIQLPAQLSSLLEGSKSQDLAKLITMDPDDFLVIDKVRDRIIRRNGTLGDYLKELARETKGVAGEKWLKYRYVFSTTLSDLEAEYSLLYSQNKVGRLNIAMQAHNWDRVMEILLEWPPIQTRRSGATKDGTTYHLTAVLAPKVSSSTLEAAKLFSDSVQKLKYFALSHGLNPTGYKVWDMLPLSFVVDWIYPIGDIYERLEANDVKKLFKIKEACSSSKVLFTFEFDGAQIEGSYYLRDCELTIPELTATFDIAHLGSGSKSGKSRVMRIADGVAMLPI